MSETAEAIAPWQHGRFDAAGGGGKVLFGRVWEDPAIELAAFRPGGRVFCIASAGCTALALAPHHRRVVAVDINPAQLAYAAGRIEGAPPEAGVAERWMERARMFGRLVGWSSARRREFAELDDPAAQLAYWRAHLDTRRFRLALDAIGSRALLSRIYHPDLLGVLPQTFGAVIRGRMLRGISRFGNRTNPHARALFLGEPTVARATREAGRIELVHADAADYLENMPASSFDGFSISNILDGATTDYRDRLFAAIRHAAAPGATLVRRSFGEPARDRDSTPSPTGHQIFNTYDSEVAQVETVPNRAGEDRALLWGIVEAVPLGVASA